MIRPLPLRTTNGGWFRPLWTNGWRAFSARAGDDVPLITSIIGSASVCVDCIARETKLKPAQADTALRVIVQSVTISADAGRCERCQKLTVVYKLR